MNLWEIREPNAEDLSFIYATWLRSYRYGSTIGRSCRNSIFFDEYSRVIDQILDKSNIKIKIAYMPDDPNVIFGYSVTQPGIIHYVFVKDAFCKNGIAKSLVDLSQEKIFYTHKTNSIKEILTKHSNLIYNPFLLFKQGASHG